MTVVSAEARRRWAVVLAAVAVLCALPVAVSAWPVTTVRADARELRDLVERSAGRAYQGYAESVGTMGLPELPRLGQVAKLLSGSTRMRAWYAAPDRWRVDVVDTGQERGTYRTARGVLTWDYGANQLSLVELTEVGVVIDRRGGSDEERRVTYQRGESPNRLPRGADLMPPDLARRLLDLAEGERVEPIAGKRVAGISAAGLRITSTAPQSTVGHIDLWADPRTGLPLEVAFTARNAERPILVTRFLEVALTTPADEVLTPPARRPGVSFTRVEPDESPEIFAPGAAGLPNSIAGLPRWDPRAAAPATSQGPVTVRFRIGEAYGTGLSRVAVLELSDRIGDDVLRAARGWGQEVTVPDGTAVLIAAPLLSVMLVHQHSTDRTFLLAGMVDGVHMQRFGEALAVAA